MQPVTITLQDLFLGVDDETLDEAFGPQSLGIILLSNLPPNFQVLREKVLKSASVLGNLPPEQLASLENPEAMWLTGWSCGKEKLLNGKPDVKKGSFYVNCAFHSDDKLEGPTPALCNKFPNHKTYTSPNIWPDHSIPGLKTFKEDCKNLCNMIIELAESLALNCDEYMEKRFEVGPSYLTRMVRESTCTKARLLHYYPGNSEEDSDMKNDDSWCGEHVDHSCLTALTSALFFDETNKTVTTSPDPESGLYIKNRNGEIVKVNIPADSLAFQTGSCLQEISKGEFKAVPHYVKGPNSNKLISRNTLAIFCQPNLDQMVNSTETFADFATRIVNENH